VANLLARASSLLES